MTAFFTKKNEVSPKVMDILEHNIEQINSGSNLHTICNGISGFGWLCEHLRKLGMLNREDIEFLDDLDLFLHKRMMVDIRQGNYDYLHGVLGVGTYFLSRFDGKAIPKYLEELLTELEESGESCENDAVKWLSVLNYETGEKGYNISLSHGMASIAIFFIRLHQLNFEAERVGKLFTRTITYIFDQITYTEDSESYFNRHDLQKNNIMDAGLCHGSAGVAHIFWNLYLNTRVQKFWETTDYWLNITMQMAKYTDGSAGFMAWRTEKFGGLVKSDSLLEGIVGIGLVLLSHLNSNETAWDKCLMLK